MSPPRWWVLPDDERRGSKSTFAVAFAAAALAGGCGAHATAPQPASAWRPNAVGVLRQLRADVAVAKTGGTTRAAAAQRLAATSDLYALLVVYDDLGGCSAMAAKAGAPVAVEHVLALPCPPLERAAALFTQATSGGDAQKLVEATNDVLRAEPLLVRALSEIARAQPGARGEK
jgi:hypothetical protein